MCVQAASSDWSLLPTRGRKGAGHFWQPQHNPDADPGVSHLHQSYYMSSPKRIQRVSHVQAVSPDGSLLATGGRKGGLHLWQLQDNPDADPARSHSRASVMVEDAEVSIIVSSFQGFTHAR